MPSEREWVDALVPRLQEALRSIVSAGICVESGKRLVYAHEITKYQGEGTADSPRSSSYQTDLLVFDSLDNGCWIPRIVIECKLGGVTTHDALIYNAKAATHKQVHPYLRYGILVGDYGADCVPVRLFRHGPHFDFMITWASHEPGKSQWDDLIGLLGQEVEASRKLQRLLGENRTQDRERYSLIHRPLILK